MLSENSIKFRLAEFLNYLGIGQAKFASNVGVSRGFANNVGNTIRPETLEKIKSKYPELNTIWLLTGEGEMLNSPSNLPVKGYTSGVPYYNVDFLGGFDLIANDQTVTPEYLIDFKEYNKATCWCNITGHSMEPEITSGDIIALREIKDKSFLPFGEIYAIITTNGMRTIKRIGPASSPKNYSLIPTNKAPEYGVQEIPRDMIYKVYEVLGCMKKL